MQQVDTAMQADIQNLMWGMAERVGRQIGLAFALRTLFAQLGCASCAPWAASRCQKRAASPKLPVLCALSHQEDLTP